MGPTLHGYHPGARLYDLDKWKETPKLPPSKLVVSLYAHLYLIFCV